MKKCESFGCKNIGIKYFQISPGTNVYLCQVCIDIILEENKINGK